MKWLVIIFMIIASTGYCATIAEQLTAINDAKTAINAAIEAKGVAVDDAPLTDYAELIGNISTGTGINATETLIATLSSDVQIYDPIYITSASAFKTANPNYSPSGSTFGIPSMSADGKYLVVPHNGTAVPSAKIAAYKWDSADARYELTFATPGVSGINFAYASAMSADGTYLAIGHNGTIAPTTFLATLKWDEFDERYELTAAPDTIPAAAVTRVAMSADGTYLAAIYNSSTGIPYLTTYKWNEANNRYEATAAPEISPGNCSDVTISSNGSYLIVARTTAPRLICYSWNETNNRYEVAMAPDILPDESVFAVAISSDSSTLVAGGLINVYNTFYTYKWDSVDGRYEKTAAPEISVTDSIYGVLLSADGTYLVVSTKLLQNPINSVFVFKWNATNNRYERHSNLDISPSVAAGSNYYLAGSSDLGYMAVVSSFGSSASLMTYKQDISHIEYSAYKANNPSTYSHNIAGIGYATEPDIAGNQIDVRMLWWQNFMKGDFTP
jgi:hypothetical protein